MWPHTHTHTHTHTHEVLELHRRLEFTNLREGPHQEAGGLFGLFLAFLTSDRSMKLFTALSKPWDQDAGTNIIQSSQLNTAQAGLMEISSHRTAVIIIKRFGLVSSLKEDLTQADTYLIWITFLLIKKKEKRGTMISRCAFCDYTPPCLTLPNPTSWSLFSSAYSDHMY